MVIKEKPQYINVMIQKKRPFTSYELQAIPRKRLKRWDKIAKPYQGKLFDTKIQTPYGIKRYQNIDLIDTPLKLCGEVRKSYGFGCFNVMFWSKSVKNKKFSTQHKCSGSGCAFYSGCRRKRVYKTGQVCKRNRRFLGNWVKRFSMNIYPSQNPDASNDFTYKILYSRMHLFWFWNKAH